jgi:hypothetical protein
LDTVVEITRERGQATTDRHIRFGRERYLAETKRTWPVSKIMALASSLPASERAAYSAVQVLLPADSHSAPSYCPVGFR